MEVSCEWGYTSIYKVRCMFCLRSSAGQYSAVCSLEVKPYWRNSHKVHRMWCFYHFILFCSQHIPCQIIWQKIWYMITPVYQLMFSSFLTVLIFTFRERGSELQSESSLWENLFFLAGCAFVSIVFFVHTYIFSLIYTCTKKLFVCEYCIVH